MTRVPIRYGARPCSLVVCRGCCCGDAGKNPGVDHEGQLARLREAAARSGGRLAVRTSDCLGPCAQANIVVVQPSTEAAAADAPHGSGSRRTTSASTTSWPGRPRAAPASPNPPRP